MDEFKHKIRMDLYIQKHQLETQSAADIIYLLCLERLRSCREKHTMHTYFQVKLPISFKRTNIAVTKIFHTKPYIKLHLNRSKLTDSKN